MANPQGYCGRGTSLSCSLDNQNFVAIAQLKQFEPTGSKQATVDQTGPSSPGPYTQHQPVQLDAGEIDLEGVLNPQDFSYLTLKQIQDSNLVAFFRAVLVDGSAYNFQASVSEFKAFSVKVSKANTWSAKLKLTGGMQGPGGVFQQDVFDPGVFADF
jgi:hypothetical protein